MTPRRREILKCLLPTMGELTQDWDYTESVGPASRLFTELGHESLDAVVLSTAIQDHYKTQMPFPELPADIGQPPRDLSIAKLAEFVDIHLNGHAHAVAAIGLPL
jgi:acyl carrier protein